MFDALRRAEAQRRRRSSRVRGSDAAPRVDPVMTPMVHAQAEDARLSPAPVVEAGGKLPEGLLRELGILRNSVETILGKRERTALLFTSAAHGEGTSTLATSFAQLLAMDSAQRVLLVEMNARSPALFWRLGMKKREGVTHFFGGGVSLSEIAQPLDENGFDAVHVGDKDAARIQLNLEREFRRLLSDAKSTYSTVVIDAPPVISSPETPPMTSAVDGVVVVARCEKTKREIVQRAIGMVDQIGGKTLGVVLNRKKYYIPGFIYKRL